VRTRGLLWLLPFAACAAVLAACGGSGATPPTAGPHLTSSPTPSSASASAVFRFKIPAPPTAQPGQRTQGLTHRKPLYISPATLSISLSLSTVNGATPSPLPSVQVVNVTGASGGCTTTSGTTTCTATMNLPVGTDVITVATYDASGASGNLLSQQIYSAAVTAGSANAFSFALDANPGNATISVSSTGSATGSQNSGFSMITTGGAQTFAASLTDADGDTIVGTGGPTLSAVSHSTGVVTVSMSGNTLTITPVSAGTASITVTATPANSQSGGDGLSSNGVSFNVTITPPTMYAVSSNSVSSSGGYVSLFTVNGSSLSTYGGPITLSSGAWPILTFDGSGNLYDADLVDNELLYFPYAQLSQTTPSSTLTITGNVNGPNGVAVSADGTVAIANAGSPQLSLFSSGSTSSEGAYAVTAGVTQWNDRSGSGNTATQSTSSNDPSYVTGPAALSFSGTQYLQIAQFLSADRSIFVVVKSTATTGSQFSQWYGGAAILDADIPGSGADWGTAFVGGHPAIGIGQSDTTLASSSSGNDGNFHIEDFLWNSSSGATSVVQDGGTATTGTLPTGSKPGSSQYFIGYPTTSGSSLTGAISELVVYSSVVTGTQRQEIEGYLACKWNLQSNLPSGHPYRSSCPTGFLPSSVSNLAAWYDAADASSLTTTKGGSTTFIPGSGFSTDSAAVVVSNPSSGTSSIVICSGSSCGSTSSITTGVNSPGGSGGQSPLLAWNKDNDELFLANSATGGGTNNLVYYKSGESFSTAHTVVSPGSSLYPYALATSADGYTGASFCGGGSCSIYLYDSTNTAVSGWNPKTISSVTGAVLALAANDTLVIGTTGTGGSGAAYVYGVNGTLIASGSLPNSEAISAAAYP